MWLLYIIFYGNQVLNKKNKNILIKIGGYLNCFVVRNRFQLCEMHKEFWRICVITFLHEWRSSGIIMKNGGVSMRDFPIFDTEYGIASLYLKEIPYKNEAYIRIRTVQETFFEEHLKECVAFCRMCGAERIYAADHEKLEAYPMHTSIVQMQGTAWVDPQQLKNLFPVTEATIEQWRQIHNEKLRVVDCSATLTSREEKGILESGGAYFIHDNGELLGLGWIKDGELKTVAAVKKGAGEWVMHTLMSLTEGEQMTLEVASTNERAIRLYEKLGFLKTAEITKWYRVL